MENRLAIVIAVDGLRASALGTYGNTSFPTPNLDDLASRALVVEWLLAKSPALEDFYDDCQSALPSDDVSKWLLTDVADLHGKVFHETVYLEQAIAKRAKQVEDSHTARFFAECIEQLAVWNKDLTERPINGLLWIHFSGLCGPWDAPLKLREKFLDEDDPSAPNFTDPPAAIAVGDAPDELLGYRVAYAAQVALLDSCLAGFLEAVDLMSPNVAKLVILVGTRGFSLGEHGCVGYKCGTLFSEQLHLPLLIVNKESHQPMPRVAGFVQPVDIGHTLSDWLLGDLANSKSASFSLVPHLSGESTSLRDLSLASNETERAIRTPAWMMKHGGSTELYSKPDDRWETNNVATRCPEIVELLRECLQSSEDRLCCLPPELHAHWG
jgi:arylsulfatase A-like enzyme